MPSTRAAWRGLALARAAVVGHRGDHGIDVVAGQAETLDRAGHPDLDVVGMGAEDDDAGFGSTWGGAGFGARAFSRRGRRSGRERGAFFMAQD